MIPDFEKDGNLPPGVHSATWSEFVDRFDWNPHRKHLLSGLRALLAALAKAGCSTLYVNGSFVTEREYPRDYDGYYDLGEVDPDKLDPVLKDFKNGCAAQKVKYLGEVYPDAMEANTGMFFSDFFQMDKHSGERKGVVALSTKVEE